MTPAYSIIAEGNNITSLVRDRFLALEITDQAGVESDRLTLTLDDRDEAIELPRKGAKIEVSIGYVGRPLIRMGRYVVDTVQVGGPARELTINANAVDMTGGIRAPKERSWHGKTLSDIVQKIASEHELQPSIDSALGSRSLPHVDQTESDMQFLQRLCADNGAVCKVADGRLVVTKHASGSTASGGSMPAAVILASNCGSWQATLADRGEYKSVKAGYQDLGEAERKEVAAGQGDPVMTLRNSYQNENEAKQAADSKLKAMNRGTRKVSVQDLIGDPTMSAECPATLFGFRQGIDGDGWIINSVTHSIVGDGYTCDLEIESKSGEAEE